MLIDLHCDTVMRLYNDGTELKKNNYHIDIEKMKKSNVLTQFFAMYVDLNQVDSPYRVCKEMIVKYQEELEKNRNLLINVNNYDQIKEIMDKNLLSGMITIEEGACIEGSLDKLEEFYDLGVRAITLTWNYENEIGYPNYKYIYKDQGLKPFGIEVIKKMNDLGILIDVSHLSDGGFWDCIKYSSKPIIATHSNARGCFEHTRNLTDDMILALKDKGGIMGMNFASQFLDGSKLSKVNSIVEHIEYIKNLAGIDVIAIGSDFDGISCDLEIKDTSYMYLLKEALKVKNYTDEEIDKIFYKNALRVIEEVL